MKLSIIGPVYNEEKKLPMFLEHIKKLKGRFQVIFVDGGSSDSTKALIPSEYMVIDSPKGRGAQMNTGVKASKGDTLLFLHCDSFLEENALEEMEKTLENYEVGCFKIKFISEKPIMKICAFSSTGRVRLRNIAFGDQGIFMKRSLFNELKGYRNYPIMEDYDISIRVKKMKKNIGLANSHIYTSDRRFKTGGYVKTMWNMQRYQHMFRTGVAPEEIAKLYGEGREYEIRRGSKEGLYTLWKMYKAL